MYLFPGTLAYHPYDSNCADANDEQIFGTFAPFYLVAASLPAGLVLISGMAPFKRMSRDNSDRSLILKRALFHLIVAHEKLVGESRIRG